MVRGTQEEEGKDVELAKEEVQLGAFPASPS